MASFFKKKKIGEKHMFKGHIIVVKTKLKEVPPRFSLKEHFVLLN